MNAPRTYTAGQASPAAETVTYYHGQCTIYWPVTQAEEDALGKSCTCGSEYVHLHARPAASDCPSMAGGSHYETVTCPHRHTGWEAAQECGRLLGARECRARNARLAG